MKKIVPLLTLCLLLIACDKFSTSELSPEAQKKSDGLTQQGYAILEVERPKEALPYFEQAITANSKNVRALQGKGIALNKLGKHSDAGDMYETALSVDKDNIGVINNLGLSHILRGDYSGAITILEPYSRTEPVHAKLIENLALGYCLKGDDAKARALYKTRLPAEKIADNLNFCKQFNQLKAKKSL